MRTLSEESPRPLLASVAAVGFFDGVHFGHRFLLENVKATARARNLATMAVTFNRHPLQLLRPEKTPALLTTTDERVSLIEEQGIDLCAMLNFTKEFAAQTAKEFMMRYLAGKLNVKALVIGYDHSLGSDKDKTFEHYRTLGEELGISVSRAARYMPPSGVEVSSTAIRRALLEGKVETASSMLGRPYNLSGKVVEGHHIGTSLGFPTANINALSSGKVIPCNGVYSAIARVDGKPYAAAVNIGVRPTLGNGSDISIEAFLPEFSGNLYGQEVDLRFISRLRDEQHFDSLESLSAQIAQDVSKAMQTLAPYLAAQ